MLKRIISYFIIMGFVSTAYAAGICSPYLGLTTINEFFKDKTSQANDVDDFVELKILDSSIPFSVFSQWSIQICEANEAGNNNDNDGCSAKINLSSFIDTTIPWLVLSDGTIGRYYNFKTGFDAILLDANDDVIDYVSVDGYTLQEQPACSGVALPYDYQASAPGASDKFIFRGPDGTGEWSSATSAAEDSTEGGSNDVDPADPAPNLDFSDFSDIIITQGTTTATVTLTLDAPSADPVTIHFYTIDGTLVSGTDYTSVDTTGTFAIGDTVLTFDVPVSATSGLGVFNFFVGIDTSSTGLAVINNHIGSITVIGSLIDHFSINIGGGSASTCLPFNFTVTAEDSSNNPVTDYSGTISISTDTSHGNFSTVTATNSIVPDPDNDDDGNADYTFDVSDAGSVILALSNEHAEILSISITDASIPDISSGNVTFSDNAFTITDNDTAVAGNDVAVAGRDHSYQIQMIHNDSVTGSCGAASGYDGGKSLKMWRTKEASDPSVILPSLAGNVLPDSDPGADNGNITFTAGIADVTLATTDIGKFSIHLEDISNTFATGTIVGVSTVQTVRPFGIGIDFENLRDADFINDGAINDSNGIDLSYAAGITGSIFAQAGEGFNMTVAGVLWSGEDDIDNGGAGDGVPDEFDTDGDGIADVFAYLGNNTAAPSFGAELALEQESITITASVVEPVGASVGSFTINGVAGNEFNNFTAGSQTDALMTYSNVGIINISASLSDADYLSSGVNVTGVAANVGRFNPYHYAVTSSLVNNACVTGAFTYSRQPFTVDVTLEAQNKKNVRTDGYRNAYATLDVETELNIQNSETTAAYDVENITSVEAFDAGTSGSTQFEIELSWNMPEQLATVSMVNLIDTSDEVTSVDGSPVTLGSTEVRFGRLNMDNVFGSELLTLTMPMYVEYYDGNNFVLNSNDTVDCSVISNADLGVVRTLSGGSSTESVVTPTSASGRLNVDITLSPAGAGNTGDVDITPGLILSAEPWLQYDWDGDGNYDNDPTARATFGIYSGDSKQIYFRQIYQ